jgi:single-stranded DNA-binding protein
MDIRIVDGRLGKDAEIKTNQQGTEYLSFTLANNSYVRGKEETKWFNILSFEPRIIALHRTHNLFVKGKAVAVTGQSDESISTKNNNIYLNRTIVANRIDLMSFGSAEKTQQNGTLQGNVNNVPQQAEPARPVPPAAVPTCEVPPVPMPQAQPMMPPTPQVAPAPMPPTQPMMPPTPQVAPAPMPQMPTMPSPVPQANTMAGGAMNFTPEDDLPF